MKSKLILEDKELIDIVCEDDPNWTQVEEHLVDQRRWVTEHSGVYKHEPSGKHYQFHYDMPSTESSGGVEDCICGTQEGVEVEQVEVKKMVWKELE